MKYIKEHYKFLLFILIMSIIGGIFESLYLLNEFDKTLIDEVIKQVGSRSVFILITTITVIIYGLICGIFGIILSNKIGLFKKFKIEKDVLTKTIIISIIGGIVMILGDLLIFGNINPLIKNLYINKPSVEYIVLSFTYGGVVEEVMLRLFFMSLIIFIIGKIFYKNKTIPIKVFIISNIISALVFALLHLPVTYQLFGSLSIDLILRCIIMNGLFGVAFGYLYRKYGIGYSMLAHLGCHLISKSIWLLFI